MLIKFGAALSFSLLVNFFSINYVFAKNNEFHDDNFSQSKTSRCKDGLLADTKEDSSSSGNKSARDEKCISGCKAQNRSDVKVCDTFYPGSSQVENHRKCLENARSTYDSCMSTCK